MNKEEVLKACIVEGRKVILPAVQLDRKVYTEVAKSLQLIGGKWSSAGKGFIFGENPKELLASIAGGQKVNLKKEFQFFATPPGLAARLVEIAAPKRGERVLEPSAGQGAIANAINKVTNEGVDCFELMPTNAIFLKRLPFVNFLGEDFLQAETKDYDVIVANPPFSKNQDIQHFYKMVDSLRPGGRLVCITSNHWRESSNKKEVAFRKFLDENDSFVHDIPAGEFKESGTSIATNIIEFTKS